MKGKMDERTDGWINKQMNGKIKYSYHNAIEIYKINIIIDYYY